MLRNPYRKEKGDRNKGAQDRAREDWLLPLCALTANVANCSFRNQMAQIVEYLPSKREAVSSNPSTVKKNFLRAGYVA
jgi:hypothetical protein